MGRKDKNEDPEKGSKNRESGGKDKSTGSDVNNAYCPTCEVWYNTLRDAAVAAHANH